MVQINFAKRVITFKIVYEGPALAGKTTNMEVIHNRLSGFRTGLFSVAREGDRILSFDYTPFGLEIKGFHLIKIKLSTVPGAVYYNATRKLVQQGADGIIFVSDSRPQRMESHEESFANVEENLQELGRELASTPHVLQFNKRDLPDAVSCCELNTILNKYHAPSFEAIAVEGRGVFTCIDKLLFMVLDKARSDYGL